MARGFPKGHWLHKAKTGELHDALGVKRGTKIPTKVLLKAARNDEPAPAAEAQPSMKDAMKAAAAK